MRKTKRTKTESEKTVTLTISILPEEKKSILAFIGGRNQSEFVRNAIRDKIKKESARLNLSASIAPNIVNIFRNEK